jgi:alanine racemase
MRIEALIDTAALEHNLKLIRTRVPKAKVLAMVKANAYGHGLLLRAETLTADFLGVATLEEAYNLRTHGISKRIVLTPGFQNKEELEHALELELDVIVHYPQQIELLKNYHAQSKIPVWFKFNTGMHRLGFAYEEALDYLGQLERLSSVEIVAVMSHLASADQKNNPHTLLQLERFDNLTRGLPHPKSILNSAGIINYTDHAYDIVRPGMLLHGVAPSIDIDANALGLSPVMTLNASVLAKVKVAAGESVGYGSTWRAAKDSEIAVIACGYGDGYPQNPKAAQVYYKEQFLPVVGRVSMDFFTIDISNCQHPIEVGNTVELWGKNLPANIAAEAIGIDVYPLLTGLMARVPRYDKLAAFSYHQTHQKYKSKFNYKTRKITEE